MRKGHPNLKIVWYEEMKDDLITVIRDLSKFLGFHLTELKILTLVKLLLFESSIYLFEVHLLNDTGLLVIINDCLRQNGNFFCWM